MSLFHRIAYFLATPRVVTHMSFHPSFVIETNWQHLTTFKSYSFYTISVSMIIVKVITLSYNLFHISLNQSKNYITKIIISIKRRKIFVPEEWIFVKKMSHSLTSCCFKKYRNTNNWIMNMLWLNIEKLNNYDIE